MDLANLMLHRAAYMPGLAASAAKITPKKMLAQEYYGKGFQEIQNRVPDITNTRDDLDWSPSISLSEAIDHLFDTTLKSEEIQNKTGGKA